MKAAFLIRCSTKNQELDRQTKDLTRLAKSLGYEYDLENLVFGEKITGKDDVTKKNRASIDKLLSAAKAQQFDVVLVSEVSRMSRDPASGRVYVRMLINMGIPVYFRDISTWTINPETGRKTPNAEQIIGAGFDAAWKYLASMKTQIASARRNQLDNGAISIGKPFFGYRRHGGKDKMIKTKWVVDEPAAEVVVDVFNEYTKEGATLKSTALTITAKYGEKFGKNFTVGTIEHILLFDSYHTGIKQINLTDPDTEITDVYDVEVPKLISTELYEAAAAKRKKNRVKSEPYPTQTTHLLSKLLKCPCCGYTMTPRAKGSDKTANGRGANGTYRMINGKKALSWICMSGINNATICPNRMSLANEKAEPIIWELVKQELIAFANLNEEERLQKVEEVTEKIDNLSEDIKNYKREIDRQNRESEKAFEIAMKSMDNESIKEIAMVHYQKKAKAIKAEIDRLDISVAAAKEEIERLENIKTFYSQPSVPEDAITEAEADLTKQRELVKELIEKIIPYKITTLTKPKRESGRGAFKENITLKNGVVLLEVYTVRGVFYVLYNANGKGAVRYAYYLSAEITYTNSVMASEYERSLGNECFYISMPFLYFSEDDDRHNDLEAVIDVNEFIEIAKSEMNVLEYQYIPEE